MGIPRPGSRGCYSASLEGKEGMRETVYDLDNGKGEKTAQV